MSKDIENQEDTAPRASTYLKVTLNYSTLTDCRSDKVLKPLNCLMMYNLTPP